MIEVELQKLTAAIDRLTEAFTGQRALPSTVVATDPNTPAPAKTAKAPKAPKTEAPAPAPEAETPPPAAPTTPPPAEPSAKSKTTLQDVRAIAQKALDAGHLNEVVALNKELGLRRISDAPEDKFDEIIKRVSAIINGAA